MEARSSSGQKIESFQSLLLPDGADVRTAINSGARTFADLVQLLRKARKFKEWLAGDGYAIHGTQETDKLGQSVSHGCVRLGDQDIETLYGMAQVGDSVVIY